MFLTRAIAGLVLGGAAGALMGYMGSCSDGTCPLTATPWRGALFGGLLGLAVSLSLAGGRGSGAAKRSPRAAPEGGTPAAADAGPAELTGPADFKARVEDAKGLVAVDFHSRGCGWCRKLAPVLDKLAGEYAGRVAFVKVDVDAQQDLAGRFGVEGLPTVIIFKDGRKAETVVGFRTEDELRGILDKRLAG